jgi:hypothetical protein
MTIITNQIFALVLSALVPALTTDVYHSLNCIFRDYVADDLSYDTTAWENVRSDIPSKITGIAGIFLEHLVFLLGPVGLTNLARAYGSTDGDCDCTDCLCAIDTWELFDGSAGTINEATRTDCFIEIAAMDRGGGNYYTLIGSLDGTQSCELDTATATVGSFDPGASAFTISPEAFNPTNWAAHSGALPSAGTQITGLLLRGYAPFTVQLTFK